MSDRRVIDLFEPMDKSLPLNVQRQNIVRIFTYGFHDKLVANDNSYMPEKEQEEVIARRFLLQHMKTCNIAEVVLTAHKELDGRVHNEFC